MSTMNKTNPAKTRKKPAERALQPQAAQIMPLPSADPDDYEEQPNSPTFARNPQIRTRQKMARMLDAMVKEGGHVTRAAELAGITPRAHQLWMRKFPKYAAKVEEVMDRRLYNAQLTVDYFATQIKEQPELAARCAMFTLVQLGGKRGYRQPGITLNQNTQNNTVEIKGPLGELIRLQDEAEKKRKEQNTP